VVLILDNGTTAMTGLQEHPGTGRKLGFEPTNQLVFEDLSKAIGIERVHVVDPAEDARDFERVLKESLESGELTVIIARHPCVLGVRKLQKMEALQAAEKDHE
jgi:indolepyruvate ferredoxin oxidoreductase alpha subunit